MPRLVPFSRNYSIADPRRMSFGNMLDDFFNDPWPFGRSLAADTFKVDVKEDDKAYTVEADLPGVAREEIDLYVEDGRFTVSVNRSEETGNDSGGYIHRERRAMSMSRSLYLSGAASEGISARLDNGVLKVEIPKIAPADTRRRIEIG